MSNQTILVGFESPEYQETSFLDSIKNKKEVLTMTETDLAAALRHCIDDCGCSWPTACQILSRMAGRAYTLAELRDLYRRA